MIASMTAFARESIQADWGQATWEIRAVNHRYLETYFKVPEPFRGQEIAWRQQVAKQLGRGKIECSLTFIPQAMAEEALKLNHDLVSKLIGFGRQFAEESAVEAKWPIAELLNWPGVLQKQDVYPADCFAEIEALLNKAIASLYNMRCKEGAALKNLLNEKCTQLAQQVRSLAKNYVQTLDDVRQKLITKLQNLPMPGNAERLEQEAVLLVQRQDVQEELDRLTIHIAQMQKLLQQGGVQGRRLDFLCQELHREANTLMSKAPTQKFTEVGIEMKALIEQMREQIQNVE